MNSKNIEISNEAKLPTKYGTFIAQAFREGHKEHLLIRTESFDCDTPLIRIHSECLTGDALFSRKCDCGEQLELAEKLVIESGCGAILYLRQEGRNIGLLNKINAYALQDTGLDTVAANHQLGFADDERSYDIAEFMLKHLGVKKIRLLTNNPRKIESFRDIEIVKRVPLIIEPNEHNREYLKTKKLKSGHLL